MNIKHPPAKQPRPYNLVVRAGLRITVLAAALWAGGRLINKIAAYLPYALGIGIGLMVIGLIIQFRRPKLPEPPRQE
ncbi:MAG TPA: hypothetical protein VFB38_03525 [Chthonomonadaceae bacterium]|nr:hypothetical protein [Chthonomonadaceae bacterium]